MKAQVKITLKTGVLDPQGEAVRKSLKSLGFDELQGVRIGKYIEVDVDETDAAKAKASVEKMCSSLLANTVIENYEVEI